MRRRARALVFLLLALVAAALAAEIAGGYGASLARGFGPLRPVVVVARALRPERQLGPREVATALTVRRVPVRFVPAGALADPREALGLVPVAATAAGSYLLASQLRPPRAPVAGRPRLGRDRHPVEIAVSGAGALLAGGRTFPGTKVDVVVTSEPSGPGPGRTYVAAAGVPLLALGRAPADPGPGGTSAATLALTRAQALRLIAAESFARKLTLLLEG
ncbi:MAG TPA: RcpC/CpaB family pilus assembly protein [Solirubrobacterales bacterium]|nr:RcpC/CpaB family pilus assembly protein [Solirubrobacterales bacterium]